MLIDVQDPLRNIILNVCFSVIVLLTILALVPWSALGARTWSRLAVWLPAPALIVAVVYEIAMPTRFDIRLDLVLLVPAYGVILFATLIRLSALRRARRKQRAGDAA